MIIRDSLGYADVFAALEPAAIGMGRPVSPTEYTSAIANRAKQDHSVVQRVL